MFFLVVEFGGHLAKEGGEECAHAGIVFLEEFLPCGGGLLDGTHGGVGGGLYGSDNGLGCLGGGGGEIG